jgi:hypothetical protein
VLHTAGHATYVCKLDRFLNLEIVLYITVSLVS